MDYEITIEQREAQPVAVIVGRVDRQRVAEFLRGAYEELFAALAGPPIGPPFARYRMLTDGFEVTAGVPLAGEQPTVGRVTAGLLPGGPVAVTRHVGAYDDLPAAYDALMAWIRDHGRSVAADPWEAYLDGPEVPQPRTEVCFPVTEAP